MKRKCAAAADSKHIPFWKMLAWNSRTISQGIGLMAIGFLQIYCTDTLKMNPALVGGLLVGSRLVDGFTDLLAGYVVDRTNTKWGRGRPYELCIAAMWFCI